MTIYKNITQDKLLELLIKFGLVEHVNKYFKHNDLIIYPDAVEINDNSIDLYSIHFESSSCCCGECYDTYGEDVYTKICSIPINKEGVFNLYIDFDFFDIQTTKGKFITWINQ